LSFGYKVFDRSIDAFESNVPFLLSPPFAGLVEASFAVGAVTAAVTFLIVLFLDVGFLPAFFFASSASIFLRSFSLMFLLCNLQLKIRKRAAYCFICFSISKKDCNSLLIF
jgi:hypothetical protein